jgi:nanoRNase/pAp phosphatase (c-di-AMP/oligoRNAs hydrolase)
MVLSINPLVKGVDVAIFFSRSTRNGLRSVFAPKGKVNVADKQGFGGGGPSNAEAAHLKKALEDVKS